MPRTVIQLYAAAVCFVAVACFALASGIAAYSAIGAVLPSFTVHPMAAVLPPDPSMTFGPFPTDAKVTIPADATAFAKRSAEEDAKRSADALERAIRHEAATSRQSLVRWTIAAMIGAGLFLFHWRLLRRETSRGE